MRSSLSPRHLTTSLIRSTRNSETLHIWRDEVRRFAAGPVRRDFGPLIMGTIISDLFGATILCTSGATQPRLSTVRFLFDEVVYRASSTARELKIEQHSLVDVYVSGSGETCCASPQCRCRPGIRHLVAFSERPFSGCSPTHCFVPSLRVARVCCSSFLTSAMISLRL